jgi:hypothetical protein
MLVNVLASRPRTLIAAAIVASMGVGIAVVAIAAQPHVTAARGCPRSGARRTNRGVPA